MNDEQYSYVKTGWKVLAAFLAALAPGQIVLESLPESVNDFESQKTLLVLALVIACIKAAQNVYKTATLPGSPAHLLNPPK